jgi:hypothetical protein
MLDGRTNKLGCLKASVTIHIACSQQAAKEHMRSGYDAWVQVWVQLKKEKWLPISRKRHQIGQLDFRSFRLLTDRPQVQILPAEPTSYFSIIWMSLEHSAFYRGVVGSNQAAATKRFLFSAVSENRATIRIYRSKIPFARMSAFSQLLSQFVAFCTDSLSPGD